MMPVRFEPTAPRSRVKHSTTEPLGSVFPDYLDVATAVVVTVLSW